MLEIIKTRRSIRSFTSLKVSEHDLEEIVTCGQLAPSGMNQQGIHFCVISNEQILSELEKVAGSSFFYHAPALIVVYCDSDYKYAQQDGSCAMTQMYLAAHTLGLGSCWINQLKEVKFEPVLKEMNLNNKTIVGTLAVGQPSQTPKEKVMKENRVKYVK